MKQLRFPPALLEAWMRRHYQDAQYDLGSSGVEPYSLEELFARLGPFEAELRGIVFRDSDTAGDPTLREAIANRFSDGRASRVMATHGSSEALFLAVSSVVRSGDEVVVLDPCYPQLAALAESLGASLRLWPMRCDHGFMPDLDQLVDLVSDRTRLVVVNFPHNPTGTTLSRSGFDRLLEIVGSVGAYLLWDAAFAELVYDQPALPDPSTLYPRSITLGTLSKAYGLPGLRVGWMIAAEDLIEDCIHRRDYLTLSLSPLVEQVARRAIDQAPLLLAERKATAAANRDSLHGWISAAPSMITWNLPRGGVTGFAALPGVADVEGFCTRLAREESVLLVPGSCFGHPRFIRLGFGASTSSFEEGWSRLSRALEREAA